MRAGEACSVCLISGRGKRTTFLKTAVFGCVSDFGVAAGYRVPLSPLKLQISMARRRYRSSLPCVLLSPQHLLPLSAALHDTGCVLSCPVLLATK